MSMIQYYRYSLVPKSGGKPREGALLRINGGYADLCPLPEFGDGTVDEELASLANEQPTDLARLALAFAGTDSYFRSVHKPCLTDLPLLRNHALLTDIGGYTFQGLCDSVQKFWRSGFRVFKAKVGRSDIKEEAERLNALIANSPNEIRLRLDPNARFTPESCIQFLNLLTPETRAKIEFIEDPTPFDASFWRFLHETYNIPIALDFEIAGDFKQDAPYQVRILKPARQPDPHLENPYSAPRNVVTSVLDHPIGQMQALYTAGTLLRLYPEKVSPVAGIASHLVYEDTPFSAQLFMKDGWLLPALGTGWGFDELLEALPWMDLD